MTSPPKSTRKGRRYHHGNLRAALVEAARAIVEEQGTRALTLREVARRVGVTHAAPYRHFKDKAALLELSPITYVDRVKAPLMLIQGASDPRVPVGEAVQIQEALEKKKIPNQLIIFPDEGHGAQKRGNQVLQLGHTLRFFQEHLK